MKMYIGGMWTEGSAQTVVRSPFDGSIVDTVPTATPAEIEAALASAERGARAMAALPAHRRRHFKCLAKNARLRGQATSELALS